MNLLIESVTRFTVGNELVRVWREEPNAGPPDNSYLKVVAASVKDRALTGRHLALELLKLDRVNAVEVTSDGQGFVVYRLEDDGSF